MQLRRQPIAPRPGSRQRGFSLIELMIALTVLIIGITGIIQFQVVSMRASSYSRRVTEAAILGEDKIEQLRTLPPAMVVTGGPEQVDPQGLLDPAGPFSREWTVNWVGPLGTITVAVTWLEGGSEPHRVVYRTLRSL